MISKIIFNLKTDKMIIQKLFIKNKKINNINKILLMIKIKK